LKPLQRGYKKATQSHPTTITADVVAPSSPRLPSDGTNSSKAIGQKNGLYSKTLACAKHRNGHTSAPAKRGPHAQSLDYVQTVWQIHNDTVHAHDAKTEDIDLKTRTHFCIIRLHQRRNNTMAMHRDYFFDNPTATLATMTLNFQRNWLNLYEPAILEGIKMAEAESIRDTPSLTEYFVTIRPGKTLQPKFDKRHHKTKRRCKHIVHTKNTPISHCLPQYFTFRSCAKPSTYHGGDNGRRTARRREGGGDRLIVGEDADSFGLLLIPGWLILGHSVHC
jgi:hypothetical protein